MSAEPIRTLVVEDDPVSRTILEEILTVRGHEAEAVEDAEAGWNAFQETRHGLALLDMRLPGMDGLELCRRIRELPESDETVILFITGVDRREALEEALEAGADDYLSKPFSDELLHVRLAIAERQVHTIREQKRLEAELLRDALHDSLTGLANRSLLKERVERATRRTVREDDFQFSVLYLDLDGFHGINQRHGEDAADHLLQEVGRRMEEAVREMDTVARIAADEFGILLDGIRDVSDPTRVANRIHKALEKPVNLGGKESYVTACIGMALSASGYDDPEEILRDAHKALVRAKNQGRATTQIFDPVLHTQATARVELEGRIRAALENEELVLHYQPLIELESRRIVGFECLVRWEDPEKGLVYPDQFIGVAEETGLIVPLGWWSLETSSRQIRAWRKRFPDDPPLTMSVNVSGRQFVQADMLEELDQRIARAEVDADCIHLEITETALMSDVEVTTRTLAGLKERNFRLHVDDFGTGYSSLSYLCRFPIDTLKIDRSFVSRMTDSTENLEVVRTVIRLAKNLGLGLVAEGVETVEQMKLLEEMGCEIAQGYLFSRPVPADAATALLEERAR